MVNIIQNINGTFDLLNNDDNSQITNEGFTNIRFENELFIAEKDGKINVLSNDGYTYIISNCDSISFSLNNSFIIYEVDNLFGIYNLNGSSLNPICSIVSEIEYLNDDGSTSFIIGIMYNQTIWNSFSGMSKELFKRLTYIEDGLIISEKEGKDFNILGFVNTKGHLILEKERVSLDILIKSKRIIINEREKSEIYDFNVNLIKEGLIKIFGFISGASIAKSTNKFGLIDINGELIEGYEELNFNEDSFDWDYYFDCIENNSNLLPFQNDGLYGFIDYNKKIFLNPISQFPIVFFKEDVEKAKGFAHITKNGLSGIIDDECNWIVEPIYEEFKDCFTFRVYKRYEIKARCIPYIVKSPVTNRYGLLSYDGKWIHEPIYTKIEQGYVRDYISRFDNYHLIFHSEDETGKNIRDKIKITVKDVQ
jgi:hypothetical protein